MVTTVIIYYPAGGLCDLRGSFDEIHEVIHEINKKERESYDIYDRIEGVSIRLSDLK